MMLFDMADELEKIRLYKWAEQVRAVGLSMSNNIAEGSGSDSRRVFNRYLDISRSSVFEGANMTIILHGRKLINLERRDLILEKCDHLARKITNFKKTLR
jgi:four helix bundle protein